MKEVEFKDFPSYGDLMEVEEFVGYCQAGYLINYDGSGKLATRYQVSNIGISPSEVVRGKYKFPEWATHVHWYNR